MATTYISANHALVAHNLPWGEVGKSPLTTAVGKSIDFDLHDYNSQAELEQAANESKIYGGFVAKSNTLIISEAASLWAPGVVPLAYEKVAKQSRQTIQPKVINVLPSEDPSGAVPGLVLFVLLIAGYLSSTFAMLRTQAAAAHRRVTFLFGFSVVCALVINLIAGPILGGYPDVGTNFWPLWGEFAFVIFAVALLAATLQSLLGAIGGIEAAPTLSSGSTTSGGPLSPFHQRRRPQAKIVTRTAPTTT